MKNINKLLGIAFLASILIAGCKKEKAHDHMDDHNHQHSDGTGTVSLATTFKVGTNPYSTDSIYTNGFGDDYKFTFVRIYLSGFQLKDHDSVDVDLPNQYLLVDPQTSSYALGSITAGHYHDFTLNIGIDSATNHSDPNTYPIESPLYPQSPSMHWAWSSGYIFYKLEGLADTNNDGNFETTFSYHIGMDMLKRSVSKTIHKDVAKDQDNPIQLTIDLEKFLTNVDFETEYTTHTMNDMPLATKIADNSVTAIDIQ